MSANVLLSPCYKFTALIIMGIILIIESQGDIYIRHGPKHERIRAGMSVTFRCTAGTDTLLNGIPDITWIKDDQEINYGEDIRFHKDSVENTLTIRNASTQDTGLYTCIAQLGLDTDSASAQLIVEDVPDPPIDVKLTSCVNRVAQLSWQLISENYSPVSQFIIEYSTSFSPGVWRVAKTQLPRDRFYQRITLSPYANYSFRVIAQNQIGESKPSLPTKKQCQMPPDVPHHNPKGVCTLNIKPKTLIITWTLVPREEQNAPGFYYLVKWRRHDLESEEEFQDKIIPHNVTSLTIESQPIYKQYAIYVLSINEVGEAVSPPRMVLGFSAEDVPLEIPTNFGLHPGKDVTSTTADFVWDSVNTGPWRMQGFFRGYKIEFWKTKEGKSTLREHSIIFREPGPCWRESPRQKRDISNGHVYNLWPYTNITAQIKALNAKYEGPPSKSITFLTNEGVPEAVRVFYVMGKGPTYFMLKWDMPRVTHGILTGYTLSYRVISEVGQSYPSQEMEITDPTQMEVQLSGLEPEQLYRMSLWAHTHAGQGQQYLIEDSTLPGGPPVVPNFTTVNVSKRAINITWFPSVPGNPGTVFTVHFRVRGQRDWQKSAEVRDRSWLVLEGLSAEKVYEVRVVARNGDDPRSQETSSPVQHVQIGMKRELSQPTFKVNFLDENAFDIALQSYSSTADNFYVQYRQAGSFYWSTTDDTPVNKWARIEYLEPHSTYELRVVTKSELGDAMSLIKTVIAQKNPDATAFKMKGQNAATSLSQGDRFWTSRVTSILSITLSQLLCRRTHSYILPLFSAINMLILCKIVVIL